MEARALNPRSRASRAWYAAALLGVLLAALLGAWFYSGWHDVRMRQQEALAAPRKAAEERAIELARELHDELGSLIAREVRRPYFHYQNLMHDPKASLGVSVSPSPLARGPEDELVLGYFQIDDQGRASTPTINDDFPDLSEPDNLVDNRAFRTQVARELVAELAPAPTPTSSTPVLVAEATPKPRPKRRPRQRPQLVARAEVQPPAAQVQAPAAQVQRPSSSPQAQRPLPTPQAQLPQQAQVVQIDPGVYVQNSKSNEIYWQQQQLETKKLPAAPASQATKLPRTQGPAKGQAKGQAKSQATSSSATTSQAARPSVTTSQTTGPSVTTSQTTGPSTTTSRTTKQQVTSSSAASSQAAKMSAANPAPTKRQATNSPAKLQSTTPPAPSSRPARPRLANAGSATPPATPEPGPVTITISPLEWRTLSFAGGPALVAVRQVQTPDANLAQGFVIDRSTLTTSLAAKAGEMVAELHTDADRAGVDIAPGWRLTVMPNPRTLAQAGTAMHEVARSFLLRFFGIGSLALLAAGSVLLLVMRAEKLARERSQFAAAAAHELRTPLAGLQLYGDMLADGLGDPGKVRDYARRMSEEASRLGRVVSNVLGFSQLERGNLSVDAQVGSLGDVLRELAERAEPALDRAGAALELDVAPDLRARFDRDALARIIGNLLDNAEKYARGADDRTITLAARERGDVVEIVVQDHGPGVAESTKLFRAFSRGVSSDGPAGLGLGLALSQSLAEAMGGKLSYRASADRGATFVLELPRA